MPKGVYDHKSLKHEGQFKKGISPHNKGIPMSEEQKIKISNSKKGKKQINKRNKMNIR